MVSATFYKPTIIVVGQSSYKEGLMPFMGSAFSQAPNTSDTPTTSIFSAHFEDTRLATEFMRSNWKLLSQKYMFVNADYYP
jgi:hypothetical protein